MAEYQALYEAVTKTGDCQAALKDLEEALKLLAADFEKRIKEQGKDGRKHNASLEGVHCYHGMVLAARVALSQMFAGFKMPAEVKDRLRGKEIVDDADYVKACVL